ncbi:protoporphyrinogen oxidase [Lujinxingia litoralis]|uniref:Protoporphyrinogen oxidase n=1 Tax=Lujinxingia litoralis TaxID=2211119 RepID=A0A328C728_9DELT|nr:flavodoxin domain-containing protein [Lujinxingia litoralis]RAL20334.1 protoporphyrinogen oxidase [Lujinxingia litoralis]
MAHQDTIALIYSSQEGQTEKIAGHLADYFKSKSYPIELLDVDDLPDDFSPEHYAGVILGGSIHIGRFSKALIRFAKANHHALNQVANAFFSVSLSAAGDDEESRQEVHHYFDVFLEATGWQPMLLAAFAGAMPFSRYGFMKRMIMRSAGRRAEGGEKLDTSKDYEYTDWASVDAFGDEFIDQIATKQTHSEAPSAP